MQFLLALVRRLQFLHRRFGCIVLGLGPPAIEFDKYIALAKSIAFSRGNGRNPRIHFGSDGRHLDRAHNSPNGSIGRIGLRRRSGLCYGVPKHRQILCLGGGRNYGQSQT
jgi:hypothetical protein